VKYVIDVRFNSSVERTPRVLEVAEGFGLGLSNKEFVIYDNLELEVRQGDVLYVTGQSGSGKSLILRELARQMSAGSLKVADLNALTLPEMPVIEIVGNTITEAADLLAKAGISDAWIYIRKPSELSDGQRYRLKLAMLMNQPADVWVADEFGAVLDRVTAKCVAFNMQKVARRLNKTLIVATTHTDLKDELGPSLTITKRFRQRVDIETATHEQVGSGFDSGAAGHELQGRASAPAA
jgi:ABC-type ATPase with predicted acetyltransferase domain